MTTPARATPGRAAIEERVVSKLSAPGAGLRDEILAGPRDAAAHRRWYDGLPCLHEVEVGPPPEPAKGAPSPARVVAWNVERGRDLPTLARVLAAQSPALVLLSELDAGMARSGNVHTARGLAAALGMGFAYGVEFVELGLGDPQERETHAGEENEHGLHGGAILATAPLERPAVVRLEADGAWFDGARGERRVGGRIAVVATLRLGGAPVTVAAVHLESHSEVDERRVQIVALLDALERYAPGRPTLVAGDLNSFSLGISEASDRERLRALLGEDPERFRHPVPHETLFAAAAERGFAWETCNEMRAATQRVAAEDASSRGGMKIDWFLARGLRCSEARVLEAAHPQTGRALSDHEPLAVTCRL